ncbi:PREDICTED: nuclear envelope integral membrane protein 1-like [Habropoda laboriosa]|uniref:nuclear envelope integral membrane protein 1-like n=1 Tax=Habropoda laboriosa TaxID=597456 RepID=UPI00083DD880|nr:PREDICTED: nuclear envelope integral membrane protein 1-like [Habropoda laboriosa]
MCCVLYFEQAICSRVVALCCRWFDDVGLMDGVMLVKINSVTRCCVAIYMKSGCVGGDGVRQLERDYPSDSPPGPVSIPPILEVPVGRVVVRRVGGGMRSKVLFLKPGVVSQNNEPVLKIFCHNVNTKSFMYMWKSLPIHLSTNTENYDLCNGKTPPEVLEKHENQRYWRFNLFGTNKSNKFKINPFEEVCIGIYAYPSNLHKHSMSITETRIDVYSLILMIMGTIIYWNAPKLSESRIFYYFCGTSIVYYLTKLLRWGKIMYRMVATSWTMSVYIIQALWAHAHIITVEYREWITLYILLTSFISFIICYWFGTITNARTKKVIQWFLQIGALFAMYHSSYFREVSIFSCIVIILLYNFPIVAIRKVRSYW